MQGWIERWADGDRTAFVFDDRSVSYRTLADRIEATAGALAAAGVERGDRVAHCGLGRVEVFELFFACARIGAVFCPLNHRLTAAELTELLADCRPSVVTVTDGFGDAVEAGAGAVSAPVRDLDTDPFPLRAVPGPGAGAVGRVDDPVLMVYTSGTTGRSKGAVHTQRAISYTCGNGVDHQRLSSHDRVVAALPTFHVGGLNIQTLPTLLVGGTVLLEPRFDPGRLLHLIDVHRPTQTLLVPAMLQAVAGHPDFDDIDVSCLVGINSGSSVVPEAVMRPFFDRGVPVGQVYGTTETGPTAVVLDYDEAAEHIGSCGRPATHNRIRLVDDDGTEVAMGEPGEILVRGPNLFSHYWDDEPATAAAFLDGWYRTGDVGHLDDDGYLYISDRLTDVVISGGENVYPAEVEAVLADHPAIAEVAVIGRPHPRWGETPVAIAVLRAGRSLDTVELREWLEGRLARFKQPTDLVVVDVLPRTALGKIRKHVVREMLADGERPAGPRTGA